MVAMGQLLPHFTIEYRKHFTDFHATVTETAGGLQIGATEQLLIMYSLQLYFAFHSHTNEFVDQNIDWKGRLGFDLPFSLDGTCLGAGGASFYLAAQYNATNLYKGFTASKDKTYAALCALPFF